MNETVLITLWTMFGEVVVGAIIALAAYYHSYKWETRNHPDVRSIKDFWRYIAD